MAKILLKSGWLGRNGLDWYSAADELGEQIYMLVEYLKQNGHEVYFAGDLKKKFQPDIEIHFDRQIPHSWSSKKILLYLEPDFVQPQNIFFPLLNYEIIFTLRSDVEVNSKLRRYVYPRTLTIDPVPDFDKRDILLSCIAGNKNAVISSTYNLYPLRQKYIAFFEDRLGSEFYLYGAGWNLVEHRIGILAKFAMRSPVSKYVYSRRKSLRCYRGKCAEKGPIMLRSKFTLCIENTSAPGAITEKIIDCIRYGSVPLYYGPHDIGDYVNPNLYIDLRSIPLSGSLIRFMENFSADDFERWREFRDKYGPEIASERSIGQYVKTIASAVDELSVS